MIIFWLVTGYWLFVVELNVIEVNVSNYYYIITILALIIVRIFASITVWVVKWADSIDTKACIKQINTIN